MHETPRRRISVVSLLVALAACDTDRATLDSRGGATPATVGAASPLPNLPDAGDPTRTSDFAVVFVSVADGDTWELNRPIDVGFNRDVDFATVSETTLAIVETGGAPVVGSYSLTGARTVRFQPLCPTDDAFETGGLVPSADYALDVPDLANAVTVLSTSGERLRTGASVSFSTPASSDPAVLFTDGAPGPPDVLVRGRAGEPSDSPRASFVEFGDGTTEFLEFDPLLQVGGLSGPVPLNLYSRSESRWAVVLRFDQAIRATATNLDPSRLGLEYSYDQVTWRPVPTSIELVDNCTQIGATVRLEPQGVAPQGASVRATVRAGFEDIVGDPVSVDRIDIAVVDVDVAQPGGANPADGSDEILESFEVGGDDPDSLEDTTFPASLPRANWSTPESPGVLEAAYDFRGDGGPGGDFDWIVRTGELFILDTSFDIIVGGPFGIPTTTQQVVNGLVQVNDLTIEAGATLLIRGPNPCTILATGDVRVDGRVLLDGTDSQGVGTLNTTSVPEAGASGNAGGGRGGTGSFRTSASTPKGGDGFGAFGVPGLGGEGGEAGYAPNGPCAAENRRGAGGGGGRLGPDVFYEWITGVPTFVRCQTLVGLDAESGFTGSPDGTGAISQSAAARGGAVGASPFTDERDDNDFFGTLLTPDGEIIEGELPGVWAGAGGGAGGDASRTATFPMTPFSPTGDEKGAGGGGAAGGFLVLAAGAIELGPDGSITADGGDGGGGENTIFFDRIGGASGGGSGGHIVLSSADRIVIEAEATGSQTGSFYLDDPNFPVHERRPLRALGGQGGAGKDSRCGANETGPTQWRTDAIPIDAFEGNASVPPQNQLVWQNCNRIDRCSVIEPPEGSTPGGGGDGSPGLIQLHVADPATQLLFPNASGTYGVDLDPTRSTSPPPVGWTRPAEPAGVLLPFFDSDSVAVSRWIPLGLARLEPPNGASQQVEILFDGTDPADGSVLRSGGGVQELAPLFGFAALGQGGAPPTVDVASATLAIPGSGIDGLYRDNSALMREFAIRVRDGASGPEKEFLVQTSSYDPASGVFTLVVDPQGSLLMDTIAGAANPEVALVPFFFRVSTRGMLDAYPANTRIRIGFDATVIDPATGEPSANPADSFSGGTLDGFAADASQLNLADWDVLRFQVTFDLDVGGTGVAARPLLPGLEFLRIPYRF